MTDLVLVDARVIAGQTVLDRGWVSIEGTRITGVGTGEPPATPARQHSLDGRWVLPGFVDIHVHGGGGHSLMVDDPDEIAAAAGFHLRHGTTRMLASLVTAPLLDLERSVAVLADLTNQGVLAGSHLEGPFLSPTRGGAQDPRHMIAPDLVALDHLLAAGRGTIRMVTVAPELPGVTELIHHLVEQDVLAAIGHTDATYAQTMAAIDAGAQVATHLFNGMRPIHHREPGPVVAAMSRPEMICEIVADGVHLHPATMIHVASVLHGDRMALITDATAAAGRPDGQYCLGPTTIDVHHGVARVVGTGSIAGSTLTMDGAVRHAVYDVGMTVVAATRAASTTPSGLIGLEGRAGTIQVGADADVVVLDDDLRVAAVMAQGNWVEGSR